MIAWNAEDWEVIMEANKLGLPVVLVPLGWQTSSTQPDIAEVRCWPGPTTVRRYVSHQHLRSI